MVLAVRLEVESLLIGEELSNLSIFLLIEEKAQKVAFNQVERATKAWSLQKWPWQ